jgi:hypothetical protein
VREDFSCPFFILVQPYFLPPPKKSLNSYAMDAVAHIPRYNLNEEDEKS